MTETKRVAQNTLSYKLSAPQTPKKIENLFLKRALIPYDYNPGLQIRDFGISFHKNHLKEGTYKNQKLI